MKDHLEDDLHVQSFLTCLQVCLFVVLYLKCLNGRKRLFNSGELSSSLTKRILLRHYTSKCSHTVALLPMSLVVLSLAQNALTAHSFISCQLSQRNYTEASSKWLAVMSYYDMATVCFHSNTVRFQISSKSGGVCFVCFSVNDISRSLSAINNVMQLRPIAPTLFLLLQSSLAHRSINLSLS